MSAEEDWSLTFQDSKQDQKLNFSTVVINFLAVQPCRACAGHLECVRGTGRQGTWFTNFWSGMRSHRDRNIRPVFFAGGGGKPAKLGMETEAGHESLEVTENRNIKHLVERCTTA